MITWIERLLWAAIRCQCKTYCANNKYIHTKKTYKDFPCQWFRFYILRTTKIILQNSICTLINISSAFEKFNTSCYITNTHVASVPVCIGFSAYWPRADWSEAKNSTKQGVVGQPPPDFALAPVCARPECRRKSSSYAQLTSIYNGRKPLLRVCSWFTTGLQGFGRSIR